VGRVQPYLDILGVWRRRGQLSYVHIECQQGGFIIAFTPNLLWKSNVTLPQVTAKSDPPEPSRVFLEPHSYLPGQFVKKDSRIGLIKSLEGYVRRESTIYVHQELPMAAKRKVPPDGVGGCNTTDHNRHEEGLDKMSLDRFLYQQ
jgi:hypothetical protein